MRKQMDRVTTLTRTVSQEELKLLPQETVASLSRFKNTKNRLETKTEVPVPRFGVNSEDSARSTNSWIIAMDGVVTPRGESVSESAEIAFEEPLEPFDRELFQTSRELKA